jgi:ABC-type antimicrobial peptide transport system, ATPase component
LAASPRIIFADEPTGNLDTKSSQEIFDLFKKLNKEDGVTLVATTHNPALGLQANRVVYLKDGMIVPQQQSGFFKNN